MSDLSNQLHLVLRDADQARVAIGTTLAPYCRDHWAAGRAVVVTALPEEDERTIKQNSFLWGFVYKNISRQAQIEGDGANADGWHLYYKRMFLGYKITKTKLPGKKRPSVIRSLKSTTDLSVRAMSIYLDKVMAHAATTFGVTFPAGVKWEDWRV